jgi:hypothetical protein
VSATLTLGFSEYDLISFFQMNSLVHAIVRPTGARPREGSMKISVKEIHTVAYLYCSSFSLLQIISSKTFKYYGHQQRCHKFAIVGLEGLHHRGVDSGILRPAECVHLVISEIARGINRALSSLVLGVCDELGDLRATQQPILRELH